MATYGKPTTSFYVNYGTADATVSTDSLSPVIIAPRYKLHKMEAGYSDAKLVEVDKEGNIVNPDSLTYPLINDHNSLPWPGRSETGVIDYTSAKLKAANCSVILNSNAMKGAVNDTNGLHCIVMTGTVQYVDNEVADELNSHEVLEGDTVLITESGKEIRATVVEVLPTYDPAKAAITDSADADVTDLHVDLTEFTGEVDCAYLIQVGNNNVATISALSGDAGYTDSWDLSTEAVKLGSFGATISVVEGATLTSSASYIVRITAEKISEYNKVYVDRKLSAVESTDVRFASSRIAPASVVIPTAYWSVDDAGVSLGNAVYINIASKSYEVASADLYLEYRELLTEDALELRTNQINDILDWVGPVHPDNPMGMMFAAASQAGGGLIYLVATEGATEADTVKAVEYAGQFESAYAIVPYLQTGVTQAAVKAIIAKYSSPTVAQFKHGWFCTTSGQETIVYDKEGAESLIGDIQVDATTAKMTLKLVAGDLLKAKVKAGDYAVIVGEYDEDSNKYEEHSYKITRVVDTDRVELQNGRAHGISRVYFKRSLSGTDYAKKLADEARAINNYHINFVASDSLNFAGYEDVSPAYLCATLAAYRSVLPPHAPMNELAVPGFSINNKMKWTDTEYEIMNAGGAWVVARNAEGELVTFHQITTLTDGTVAEEDSVVSNAESIVRRLRIAVRPYASGKCNVTQSLLMRIQDTLVATLNQLQNESVNDSYGPRILDYSIPRLEIPEGNSRSVVCYVNIDLPQPLQDGTFYFNLF